MPSANRIASSWAPSLSRVLVATGLAASLATVFAAALAASPAAAQCGQDYHGAPSRSSIPGGPPLAIGDSVLADAVPELVREGFAADGMVCRQMSQGLALLQARAASLPHLVVLALGTNGEATPRDVDTALRLLGPQRLLVLVTPHGSVVPSTPQTIRSAAAQHPGRVLLLDWDRLAAEHRQWLAPDGVHLGGPAGIAAFAQLLATALPYAGQGGEAPTGEAQAGAGRAGEAPASEALARAQEAARPNPEPGTPVTIDPRPHHQHAAHTPSSTHRSPSSTRQPAAPPGRTGTPPASMAHPQGAGVSSASHPASAPHPAAVRGSSASGGPGGAPAIALGLVLLFALAAAAGWWRRRLRVARRQDPGTT
jgi:hypothetical protein